MRAAVWRPFASATAWMACDGREAPQIYVHVHVHISVHISQLAALRRAWARRTVAASDGASTSCMTMSVRCAFSGASHAPASAGAAATSARCTASTAPTTEGNCESRSARKWLGRAAAPGGDLRKGTICASTGGKPCITWFRGADPRARLVPLYLKWGRPRRRQGTSLPRMCAPAGLSPPPPPPSLLSPPSRSTSAATSACCSGGQGLSLVTGVARRLSRPPHTLTAGIAIRRCRFVGHGRLVTGRRSPGHPAAVCRRALLLRGSDRRGPVALCRAAPAGAVTANAGQRLQCDRAGNELRRQRRLRRRCSGRGRPSTTSAAHVVKPASELPGAPSKQGAVGRLRCP